MKLIIYEELDEHQINYIYTANRYHNKYEHFLADLQKMHVFLKIKNIIFTYLTMPPAHNLKYLFSLKAFLYFSMIFLSIILFRQWRYIGRT